MNTADLKDCANEVQHDFMVTVVVRLELSRNEYDR